MKVEEAILGQEVIVPKYGYGRITAIKNEFPGAFIEVTPYVAGYAMRFDPKNVTSKEDGGMKVTISELEKHLAFLQRQGVSPNAEIHFDAEEPEREPDGQCCTLRADAIVFLLDSPDGPKLVNP